MTDMDAGLLHRLLIQGLICLDTQSLIVTAAEGYKGMSITEEEAARLEFLRL
jgi:hypothetical protein